MKGKEKDFQEQDEEAGVLEPVIVEMEEVLRRAPASELAREAGAELELDPESGAFRVRPAEGGAVAAGVFAVGEVTGPCSAAEAAEQGRRAGEGAGRG